METRARQATPRGSAQSGGVRRVGILGWADGRVCEGASGWGNLYLKLLPHYGPGRLRDTLLREGPGFPASPGP